VATAAIGLVVSIGLSAVAWWYLDLALFLVFLPFVPFLFRRGEQRPVRECPACGYRTRDDDHEYCPRDGERLE